MKNNESAKNTHYRKQLTREKIANAAIDIVRDEGQAALSMRKIASLFDADVAALYRHFKNKAELLNEIGVIASTDIDLELPEKGSLQKRFIDLANSIRHSIVNHPELGIHGQASAHTTPFFAKANGLVAELFFEAGLRNEDLVYATQTLLHLSISIAESEVLTQNSPSKNNRLFAKTVVNNLSDPLKEFWPMPNKRQNGSINFDRFFEYAIKNMLSSTLKKET